MENHKSGKWAKQILDRKNEDGMWGNFHGADCANYTEPVIRRLKVLGFTKEDPVIQTVLNRMCLCVSGKRKIDDYSEKKHDWALFEKLMLSAWIRVFDPENETAIAVAKQWAAIAEKAFGSGQYCREDDVAAFTELFGRKPNSAFETGFGMFYHAALLKGMLSSKTEGLFLEYYLAKPDGMYYIYEYPLHILPEVFSSKKASRYLGAIEILSEYRQAPEKLQFVVEWLACNKEEKEQWDFGTSAKDGIYFPLSDSWRKPESRKSDCTERVLRLLQKLSKGI